MMALFGSLMTARAELPPFPEGAWTMAIIPDTQSYVTNDEDAPLFTEMTEWLAAQRRPSFKRPGRG